MFPRHYLIKRHHPIKLTRILHLFFCFIISITCVPSHASENVKQQPTDVDAVIEVEQNTVIKIGVSKQSPDKISLRRPQRGDHQSSVLKHFGEPESKHSAVGSPPISHWRYKEFTVYFEEKTVINTVLKHTPKLPKTEIIEIPPNK